MGSEHYRNLVDFPFTTMNKEIVPSFKDNIFLYLSCGYTETFAKRNKYYNKILFYIQENSLLKNIK